MDKINTINELYKRLTPALNIKSNEVNLMFKSNLGCIDIWNYLVANKWKNKKDLRLYELVNDIFNTDNFDIIEYNRKLDKNEL